LIKENGQYIVTTDTHKSIDYGEITEISPSTIEKPAQLRSSSDYNLNSELYDLVDFPVNIIVKENPEGTTYLTSQGLNKTLIFKTKENNNSNQKFYLSRIPLTGQLAIWTKVNDVKKLVSAGVYTNAPDTKVLYVKDGTSPIGATWDFIKGQMSEESFILENSDVLESGNSGYWMDVYNCVIGANGKEVYFGKYLNRRTQEFAIQPVDNFTLKNIEYIIDGTETLEQIPDFAVTWYYINNTSVKQSMTTNISEKASRTSTFSNTSSVSMNVSTEIKCGVPFIASGKINTSIGASTSFTYGKSESQEDSRSYNFPIEIAPQTSINASLIVSRFNLNVKYIATFIGASTNKEIKIEGRWSGVDCTDIKVVLEETNIANHSVKKVTLNGVPTQTFRMSDYSLRVIGGSIEKITIPLLGGPTNAVVSTAVVGR
jgi:hypothetical protein